MRRSSAAGGNVPALDAAGLLELAGDPGPGIQVRLEDWERLPAVHRGPRELWALRERVLALVASADRPDGIVITHGTDTLEETAYLLARTVSTPVPIVLTGAMRTSTDSEWDGPRNLRDAFAVASHPEALDRGAMLVFAGRILDGLDAVKLDSFAPDTFRSVHSGQLGTVAGGVVRFGRPPEEKRAKLAARGLEPRVALIPLLIGDDGALLDLARSRFDGVVIEAFGRGNAPPGAVPAIGRWLEERKPVVLASRCPYGEVGGEYAFDGAGGQLLRMGVIPAGARSPALARLELVLCLSAGVIYGTAA